jgi:DNA-binding IclR family transcriptional regulator
MNNTLKNGIKLLEYLASTAETHSVKGLAEHFALPNSHICRLLRTLLETGYVEQVEGRKYRISLKVLNLSNACLRRLEIRNRLRPYVSRLSKECSASSYLMVPFKNVPLIIDAIYPEKPDTDLGMVIGSFNPLHASAAGKICAAFCDHDEIAGIVANYDFVKFTKNTIVDPKKFMTALEEVKKQKTAFSDSERDNSLCGIASPVFNFKGEFTAIIGVAFRKSDSNGGRMQSVGENVREFAESASYALGYAMYK